MEKENDTTESNNTSSQQNSGSSLSGDMEALLARRLDQHRFANWEDDVSMNSRDCGPFENRLPICDRPEELAGLGAAGVNAETIASMASNDRAPIPSNEDREMYSVDNDGKYWMSGLRDYLSVMEIVAAYDVSIRRYFDFGCASGRVLRHFAAQTEIPEIWGSDLNARHIRWLCEFMPKTVKPISNHALPMLPIADASMDLITAFSVFTHIDTFETCWLAELKRVLASGGMAYVTVHNEDTWNVLRDEIDNPNNRLIKSMKTVDPGVISKLRTGPLPASRTVYRYTNKGPYRAQVFHSNDYIRDVWGRFFQIVEILPCHHVRQSVVIMK